MKVTVDKDLCCGHAVCLLVAPEVFILNDKDQAELLPGMPSADQEDATREAADECPARAIIIEEDAT